MKYDIYLIRENNGVTAYDLEESFKGLDKAQKKFDKIKSKYKKAEVRICPIPAYGVGYKIYKKGEYYKTIIGETDNFWIVTDEENKKTGDSLFINDYFLKEGFENYFVKGIFDAIEEELDGN